jgi:hypothetical protein
VDVRLEGVYAVKSTGGLWLLPYTGGEITITTSGYWHAVGGGAAYGTETSSVPSGEGNMILRLDLNTGSTADWFYRPGQTSSVVAFSPNGNPVIYVQAPNGLQIWTGTGPPFTEIADLQGSPFYPSGDPIADSHGIWLAGAKGIALHLDGQGWFWMGGTGGRLAGVCIP